MESVDVTDLYEAAYLVAEGGRICGVQCIPLSRSVGCSITITGEELGGRRAEFAGKQAAVNLFCFRNAYTRVNGLVHEAKKAFDREQKKGREAQR
jgi:hypothetical protein